jgi:O-antigen ligase
MRIQLGGGAALFLLSAAFLVAMFLLGGSARDDVLSLFLLRPLAVVGLGVGLMLVPREVWRDHRALLALALALPLLALLYLIPLPPALWRAIPGRELVWQVGELAGGGQPWRPLSLVPYRTWNSLWSFFAPLAMLCLALCLHRDQSRKMAYVLTGVIFVSGVLGLLQSIGSSGNGFYLYRITNDDSAVGLLANRNHQAMLLAIAFPTIAAVASLSKGSRETVKPKLWLAAGAGVMVLPFLLVTGSRAGLVLGAVAIALSLAVYRNPSAHLQARRQPIKAVYRWAAVGVIGASLVLMTALVARSSAIERLFSKDATDDLRLRVWGPILREAWAYFPFGSGNGTFVEAYQVIEPTAGLSPQYLNHAHNDFLELLLTGGLPAVAVVLCAAWYLGRRVVRAFLRPGEVEHRETVLARLGGAIVVILALGSAYDYPLRVPSLACLFALGVAWLVRREWGAKRLAFPETSS